MSAVELSLTDIMDKIVVDDWGQCQQRPVRQPARAMSTPGKLSAATLHAELGEIVAGRKPGRESDDETILLWHRGLSTVRTSRSAQRCSRRRNGWASASSSGMHDARLLERAPR